MGKGRDNDGGALACCAACGACACCCILVLVVIGLAGLGIAKIVMGAVYLHDCDLEPLIPIFLIVSGVAPILMGGFGRREGEEEQQGCSAKTCCGLIGWLFNTAWLICGSVWVYPNYGKRFDDNFVPCTGNVTTDCTKTCDADLMKFSLAMVTIDWIFFGLWCIVAGLMIKKICDRRSAQYA